MKSHYGDDIKVEELPNLVKKYGEDEMLKQDYIQSQVDSLQKAMKEFKESQEVLDKIGALYNS